MKRSEIRELTVDGARRWCELQVELSEDGRLSICGTEGPVLSVAKAQKLARGYWVDFFEDAPEEIIGMNKKFGTEFHDAEGAAEYVLEVDGEYHGLDIHQEDGDDVYLAESFGQMPSTLARFFPEAAPFLRFHLNDMYSTCEHQRARGESYDRMPKAECLECGYKIGTAWLKEELPPEVVQWAKTGKGEPPKAEPPVKLGRQFEVYGKRSPKGSPAGAASSEDFVLNGSASSVEEAHDHARTMLNERYDHVYVTKVVEIESDAVEEG